MLAQARATSRCPCAAGRLLRLPFRQGWVCIALSLRYIRTPGQTFTKPLWLLVGGANLGRPGRDPTRAHSPAHSGCVTVTGATGVEHVTQCEVKCSPPISPQRVTSARTCRSPGFSPAGWRSGRRAASTPRLRSPEGDPLAASRGSAHPLQKPSNTHVFTCIM